MVNVVLILVGDGGVRAGGFYWTGIRFRYLERRWWSGWLDGRDWSSFLDLVRISL